MTGLGSVEGPASAGLRRLIRVAAAAPTLVALLVVSGCAEEPLAEPVETSQPAPEPTVEPEPEPAPAPEPQPGAGPECPTDHCVSIAYAGDFLFHPGLWRPFALPPGGEAHFDFEPLFAGAKPYLDRTDLAIYQQETPLAEPGGVYAGFPLFNTPPEVAAAAKAVGFDVATTASNHSVDQGAEGLVRTLDTLDSAGLAHTGTYRGEGERDQPLIVEANGVKVAIITSTYGLNGNYNEHDWQVDFSGVDFDLDIARAIDKATLARDQGAEIVIGVQHAGAEYWSTPTTEQAEAAHQLMDSGAFDMLYSHHSHSVQPFEFYDGKWIHYGTGNFISESAPKERRVNNEFLLTRAQFAKQADGSWAHTDLAWVAATNLQAGGYRWCPVASDAPQGTCQWPEFDADVRERTRSTVESLGAAEHGLHEWLISTE